MKQWKWILAAVILFVIGMWAVQHFSEKKGEATADLRTAKQEVHSAELAIPKAETVYVHDTLRLSRAVTQYDTLRVTERITDTVWVKQFIVAADSVKKACTDAILSCNQRDSAHRVLEEGLRRENAALQRLVPGRTERFVTAGKWLAVGYGMGSLLKW